MAIKNFLIKYERSKRSIKDVVAGWQIDKKVDDFLGSPIMSGVLIGQYLTDEFLQKKIPPDLQKAFALFKGDQADEVAEIKEIIRSRFLESPEKLDAYLNNIKGRVGEIRFQEQMGDMARLPESVNQPGYDVILGSSDEAKYVSVKLHQEASTVIEDIKNTQSDLLEGKIWDGDVLVDKVDYAVNRDIYDEVVNKVKALGIEVEIRSVDVTHAEVVDMLDGTVDAVVDPLIFCLSELAGVVAVTSAFHLGTSIFLWRYRDKALNDSLRDALYKSATSAAGVGAAFVTRAGVAEIGGMLVCEEMVLASALLGPVGFVAGLASAVALRRVLNGFVERRNVIGLIAHADEVIAKCIARIEARLPTPVGIT